MSAVMILVTVLGASAQAGYPERAVTYIIAFNPGGQSDVEARRQQPYLEKTLGVSVQVQYKVGGGGSVGWAELAHARPDGYTIAGINMPHIVLQPLQRGDAGYETDQLRPVAWFQNTPIGLAVLRSSPFQTLEDVIAYAKENPGALTVGGSGTFSGHHLATTQLEKLAGIHVTYVPFTGAAPQVAAFLGGHVAAAMGNSDDLVQHRDRIRVLAIGSEQRFEALPDVPTFRELGFEMTPSIDRGVAVPAGTPDEVVRTLEEAFLEIVRTPEVRRQMVEQGFAPLEMGADEAQAYVDRRKQEYMELLRNLGQL
ncbi:bug family protein [Limnochorda pilosa]|uniref:Bug family protein n=1 Tax=Limnochorda pilosa TaxID=1555112 RepID=A0A0K2SL53_LIMPI|nr:bug family protein [Limnochorda pilosa]